MRDTLSIITAAIVLFLAYLLLLIFAPFATPLVFAAVVVVVFYPMHVWFKHRMPNALSALLSTIIVLIIIIIPVFAISAGIAQETIDLAQTVGTFSIEKIVSHAHTLAAKIGLDLDIIIRDVAQRIAGQAGKLASQVIGDTLSIVIGCIVALLATFYFFRDGEIILAKIRSLPVNKKLNESLIKDVGTIIKLNIAASFAAASLQGLVGGLAFAWLNLPAPILWGTVMAFFSIFPFIGSWLIWVPTAIGLAISDRIMDAVILAIIGIAIINPIDNIIRPAIVSSGTHLNVLLILIGLLGGLQAFGVSGLLLGPVLVIVAATLLRTFAKSRKLTTSQSRA